MISKSKGLFLQVGQASYWTEALGNVWVADETKKADVVPAQVIANTDVDYVESVYKVFVNAGHPLTVPAIKKTIGKGVTINDVIRAVNQLLTANLVTGFKSKSSFDEYMLK